MKYNAHQFICYADNFTYGAPLVIDILLVFYQNICILQ